MKSKTLSVALFTLGLVLNIHGLSVHAAVISGEQKVWHKITLTFDGPATSETATPNPFRDYLLDVTFTQGTAQFVVPGYYAADGNAAETSATSGNKWRVHFTPNLPGTWNYKVSFRTGTDIAASIDPNVGTPVYFDGETGVFDVTATDKTGSDFRGKGFIRNAGNHYLQHANGQYFLKGGCGSPENFLGYFEFDNTQDHGGATNSLVNGIHQYPTHVSDWQTGDSVWKGSKGKAIIGALNYLASKGVNSLYFLSMNVNGDGREVYPWTSYTERYRYDCSKLDQWEIVFSHMTKKGILLHLFTQETENDQLLDAGDLGIQRRIYYRELVARFGHHPGLIWNLGEENTNTDAQRKQFTDYFKSLDPYDHPVVCHTFPGDKNLVYTPLLGYPGFDGATLQDATVAETYNTVLSWRNQSESSGVNWLVSLDEIGPAGTGVVPDANDANHDGVRKNAMWAAYMAGAAGCEWYFGYNYPNDDLDCEDFRSRDKWWDQSKYAVSFFNQYLPYWQMKPDNSLISTTNGFCFAKPGNTYAVYLKSGGTCNLNVGSTTSWYNIKWYNPKTGGNLQNGTVSAISGTGFLPLGMAPTNSTKDWVVLVRPGTPTNIVTQAVTNFTLINADTDQPIGALTNGMTVSFGSIGTSNLNIRADTSPTTVGSVRFAYDTNSNYRTESVLPYAIGGDSSGNYNAWTPSVGTHTLKATPYTGSSASGTAGKPLTINFTVTN